MSALVYAMPLTVALAKVTSMLDFSGTRLWSISVSAWGGRVVGGRSGWCLSRPVSSMTRPLVVASSEGAMA